MACTWFASSADSHKCTDYQRIICDSEMILSLDRKNDVNVRH